MLRPNVLFEGCHRPGTLLANTCSDAQYDISHWTGWIHLVGEIGSPPETVPSNSYILVYPPPCTLYIVVYLQLEAAPP